MGRLTGKADIGLALDDVSEGGEGAHELAASKVSSLPG